MEKGKRRNKREAKEAEIEGRVEEERRYGGWDNVDGMICEMVT